MLKEGKMKFFWFLLFSLATCFLGAISIYDIQYTTSIGEGTYPSPHAGENVSTSGICIGSAYSNSAGYFLSMPEGGAWKSIYVYDSAHSPAVGSEIQLSGQVWEYHGWTELRTITSYQVLSTNNPLPNPVNITSNQVNDESFESVLVKVANINCTQGLDEYDQWLVNDGSGDAMVAGGFFDQSTLSSVIQAGTQFSSITGITSYSYNTFRINPRNEADIVQDPNAVTVSIPSQEADINTEIIIPLNVSQLSMEQHFSSYHFHFAYTPTILQFLGYDSQNTLSSIGTVNITNQTASGFQIQFSSNGFLIGSGQLLKLRFMVHGYGTSDLLATQFFFNDTEVTVIQGQVTIHQPAGEEHPDTITVIQRPLPNITSIVVPGEQLTIECVAPATTTGWTSSLHRKNESIDMTVNDATFSNNPNRWVIHATVPNIPLFEMYDLAVSASGGIADMSKHSVQVVPSRKSNYYFAHVTDLHMPTHIFWPDAGYDTDSTETVDFREVIKDLNIIRPEFVLLTGDLVNQGENEDLDNLHWYSKAQRLLMELEVPVYVVAGNHDLGGWTDEPPTDGTARRDWWKFFGWSWLNNASTSYAYHTQDYSFDYGPIHYVGMEAYLNYDGWESNIYGDQSFTTQQMQWLQNDLNSTTNSAKVLFYHYDYSDQIDLNALGVNMALWGHIHSDQGSINQTPYNLATAATCDGERAYRIIRVNNTQLQPYATLNAGSTGNQIQLNFYPSNVGAADSVTATLVNNQPLSFENSLIKFNMPPGNANYSVSTGTIEQIDRTSAMNTCYVNVNVLNNQTLTVSLWNSSTAINDNTNPSLLYVSTAYPNPFMHNTSINVKANPSSIINVSIYNVKGERVNTLTRNANKSGYTTAVWNGLNQAGKPCQNGVYFIKFSTSNSSKTIKTLLLH